MHKKPKKKIELRRVSDKVREAHHGVILVTATEEIACASLLNSKIGEAIEKRDYREAVKLSQQAASHYNRIGLSVNSTMSQLNYDDDDDDDFDDDD